MSKRTLVLVIGFLIFSVLIGCTNSKGDKPFSKVDKSLSMLDVVGKAQQMMAKQQNYTVEAQDDVQMDLGNSMRTEVSTNQTISITTNPKAYHSTGTSKILGKTTDLEGYFAGGVIYQKSNGKWIKISSGALNTFLQQNMQSEESLKQFKSLVQAYQGGDKTDEISMKQTKSGDYEINITINSAKGNQVLKQQVVKILQSSMQSNSTGIPMQNLVNNLQIQSYKAILLVDGDSFQYKSMEIDSKMAMKISERNMTSIQHQVYTFKGPFHGKIEVPADVKASAVELSKSLPK